MKFKRINVAVPAHDCDVVLTFPGGECVLVQCRPSNADVNSNGSLDIILPANQNVTCWEGDDMAPAKGAPKHPEVRYAKQLVMELPR